MRHNSPKRYTRMQLLHLRLAGTHIQSVADVARVLPSFGQNLCPVNRPPQKSCHMCEVRCTPPWSRSIYRATPNKRRANKRPSPACVHVLRHLRRLLRPVLKGAFPAFLSVPRVVLHILQRFYRPFQWQFRTGRFTAHIPGFESVCRCCPNALGHEYSRRWAVAVA